MLGVNLCEEQPKRGISVNNDIHIDREDNLIWSIKTNKTLINNNLSIEKIGEQIYKSRVKKLGGYIPSLLINKLKTRKNELIIETIKPLSAFKNIFCNPSFNIKCEDKYKIVKKCDKELVFKSKNNRIVFISQNMNIDYYSKGIVNISGPMGISEKEWKEKSNSINSRSFRSDLIYTLSIPEELKEKYNFNKIINKSTVCNNMNGMVLPIENYFDIWTNSNYSYQEVEKLTYEEEEAYQLVFSNYHGNRSIAEAIKNEIEKNTTLKIFLKEINYDDLLNDNYGNSKNFRLLIAVPSWPHPTALYFPYTFKGNRDFNKIIFDSLSASNLDDSLTILIKNSEILSKLTVNNIPIGQIIGCFRSNLDYPIKDLFIPPSSWLCYSKFFGDNNEY